MKSKFLVLGLIALMLAGGLVLASCGDKCSKDGKCSRSYDADGNADLSTSNVCDSGTCATYSIPTKGTANSSIKCDC